ncbi:stage II sporulation protein P [Salirhabdus euzebyi]|uniref:Stage II sporulation protein P n=1 Tax=Salirhabdus euzebyi TaxID=394506 RepID=A0A841Q2J3_9BACI|nr:stage II sporulation protein P [Salirhabdus euzebyi]MBB6452665.1 stage II sporulation protein P [Salirhabdus euzebyi]
MNKSPFNENLSWKDYVRTYLNACLLFLIVIIFVCMISIPKINQNLFGSFSMLSLPNNEAVTNTALLMFGSEIPGFEKFVSERREVPDVGNAIMELLTDLRAGDLMSFLEQEVPGLKLVSTEIYVAGKGTDFSTLPAESPPPNFDELLAEDVDEQEEEEENEQVVPSENSSVFIYHSHSWEAFRPLLDGGEDVVPSNASSVDNNKNIVLVGSMLSDALDESGISNTHDKTNMAQLLKENNWTYYDSYKASRNVMQNVNEKARYFIDIHRDSATKDITTIDINGKNYARLYFIVGTANENYDQNLKFVEELNAKMEAAYPGISRGIFKKSKADGDGLYNQDLSERAILIEVGGIDNNEEELKNTIDAFSTIFTEMYFKDAVQVNQ